MHRRSLFLFFLLCFFFSPKILFAAKGKWFFHILWWTKFLYLFSDYFLLVLTISWMFYKVLANYKFKLQVFILIYFIEKSIKTYGFTCFKVPRAYDGFIIINKSLKCIEIKVSNQSVTCQSHSEYFKHWVA